MRNLDFAKLTIWTCLLLTAAGVAGHFYIKGRIEQAENDKGRALLALSNISQARKDIRVLEDEMERDEYSRDKADGRQRTFFSRMAKFAGMGDPVTGEARDDTPSQAEGYTDSSTELSWGKINRQQQTFTREQIAKFVWKLEERTNLLKVTYIKMETDPRDRNDQWTLRLWVTERWPTSVSEVQ